MSRFGGGTAAAVVATLVALSGVAGWTPVSHPVADEEPGGEVPGPDPGRPEALDPRERPLRPVPARGEDDIRDSERPGLDRLADPVRKPTRPRPDEDVPFALLERGFWSYYRYGDHAFSGGCLAIRDNYTWSLFWSVHKSGVWPEPPPPAVDFSTYIVVACIQGFWSDCCSTYVEIVGIRSSGGEYVVSVVRHYEHGMMAAVTNPYYIVTTERTEGPVRFIDANTGAGIPELPPVP